MDFHIDEDRGDIISGWFLPDNPSKEPSILVEADRQSCIVSATRIHSNMVDAGQHDTGNVGFAVTERQLPGLAQASDVRLTERESGLVFYIRPKPRPYATMRLFAFEMREAAESRCWQAFSGAFQMGFPDVHRFAGGTRRSLYKVSFTQSVFACGATCLRADEPYFIETSFKRVALLADPVRILFDVLGDEDATSEAEAVDSLVRQIRRLDPQDRRMLDEQLTKRLSLLYPDDVPDRQATFGALDTLSEMDAIGIEEDMPAFIDLTAAVCGIDRSFFGDVPATPPFIWSSALRRHPLVREVAGRDLDIYDATRDAIIEAAKLG